MKKEGLVVTPSFFMIIRQMSILNDKTIARLAMFGPWGSLCSGEKIRSKIIA
jgi:hypothetical protein